MVSNRERLWWSYQQQHIQLQGVHIYIMEEKDFIDQYILFFRLFKDKPAASKKLKKVTLILSSPAEVWMLDSVNAIQQIPLPKRTLKEKYILAIVKKVKN